MHCSSRSLIGIARRRYAFEDSADSLELSVEGQGSKISEALHVIVDGPKRADLGILQDPGIENGEQSYLFSFRLPVGESFVER